MLTFSKKNNINFNWKVDTNSIKNTSLEIKEVLLDLAKPIYLAKNKLQLGVTKELSKTGEDVLAFAPDLLPKNLGSTAFKAQHNIKYAYMGGAMANGISSVEMVVALSKAGFLGSFGAAGLSLSDVKNSIIKIQEQLTTETFAVNLIHSPAEKAIEQGVVETLLELKVKTVEASAYLDLTEHIVWFRVAGLSQNQDGSVNIGNKVIAKVSRSQVARRFMEPAPQKYLDKLLKEGKITEQQAMLSKSVPMADDITAEADSGGHTDNRAFLSLIPSIISLRDQIQAKFNYKEELRVGAGGGIGTPQAALAAYNMGAAYIVIGSINQSCIEAGASSHTRKLLSGIEMADVTMAPAADMFEMGVKLQVVKRGSMFAMRANKLYEIYREYESIEDIPPSIRQNIEKMIFQQNLDLIWDSTVEYCKSRDPKMLERALSNPKTKMALIFRWYLGLSSRWSNTGEKGREMDYQIWAGPSLGAFNTWVKGTYLEEFTNRKVVDIALHLLRGAAYLERVNQLKLQGVSLNSTFENYIPEDFVVESSI